MHDQSSTQGTRPHRYPGKGAGRLRDTNKSNNEQRQIPHTQYVPARLTFELCAAVECQQSLRSIQSDYTRFKLENAIKRVFDPVSELYWTYYESSNVRKSSAESSGVVDLPSVVLLHGICGTAGCYFYIVNKLAEAVSAL